MRCSVPDQHQTPWPLDGSYELVRREPVTANPPCCTHPWTTLSKTLEFTPIKLRKDLKQNFKNYKLNEKRLYRIYRNLEVRLSIIFIKNKKKKKELRMVMVWRLKEKLKEENE